MSWLFSQVLVVEYLGDISLDGEQSVPLSGNNTQLAYLQPDKMTEFSRLSRFGMMFKPLTETLGEELLMLYRADFHAKTSLPQVKEQGLTENAQECGKKWQGSFAKYDPSSCLWKTAQCSLIEDLTEFLQTWPTWGLMRNGECWERQTLGLNTIEKEYGLLPDNERFFHTPTTGSSGGSNSRKAMQKRGVIWPTPTTPTGGGQCRRVWGTQKCHQKWNLHTIFNQPEPLRMVDGVAARVDRLKAIGNGQVPQVAAIAWELLTERLDERI
jgi:hypothetical protein